MARDIKFFADDIRRNAAEAEKVFKQVPRIMAGAAIKMKDANFSARGFIENGSVVQPWPARKSETTRSGGKGVLTDTGTMQDSVKARVSGNKVTVGIDLNKVPYAQIHNEGGKTSPHTITAKKGKALKFSGSKGALFRRNVNHPGSQMPERKFLGYTPDIEVILDREMTDKLNRIFSK